jgi:7-cyano-7-deazaguanine reductase
MKPGQLLSSPLGKKSAYVSHYDPGQLCPIPRQAVWEKYGHQTSPYYGLDIWNAYEISWLNKQGLPQIAIGEFTVPVQSPNLIESKSFKLYLNSFNQTRIDTREDLARALRNDLSGCAGETVNVKLFTLDDVETDFHQLQGSCLDGLDVNIDVYNREPALLCVEDEPVVDEKVYSHLLKTNCPVTEQPDWASIYIEYTGKLIEQSSLLKYIVSFREQCDFHEQCTEIIFLDILEKCQPTELTVYSRYLRRGGLDINPWRSTKNIRPENIRLIRQ